MTQLSLFKTEVSNNIVKFERVQPVDGWMVELVDYVTDVMTPLQWKMSIDVLNERYSG